MQYIQYMYTIDDNLFPNKTSLTSSQQVGLVAIHTCKNVREIMPTKQGCTQRRKKSTKKDADAKMLLPDTAGGCSGSMSSHVVTRRTPVWVLPHKYHQIDVRF